MRPIGAKSALLVLAAIGAAALSVACQANPQPANTPTPRPPTVAITAVPASPVASPVPKPIGP